MFKYYFTSLLCLFSFIANAVSSEYEKREITRCRSVTNNNPVQTAICAGKALTTAQINKCIKRDCFASNNELRKTFISLYTMKLRNKQSCGNVEIHATNNDAVEFSIEKAWKLCSGYKVIFKKNGNLVIYNKHDKVIWSSGTDNKGADRLKLLPTGDLVIYRQAYPVWSSRTYGNPGAFLVVQEDGNLAIYNRYQKPVWATGTNGK